MPGVIMIIITALQHVPIVQDELAGRTLSFSVRLLTEWRVVT